MLAVLVGDKMKYKKILKIFNNKSKNKNAKVLKKYDKYSKERSYESRLKRLKPYLDERKRRQKQITRARHRKLNEAPHLSIKEEVGNAVTHGVGAILAVIGLIILLIRSTTPLQIMGALFYGISMFFMMTMSSLYHSFKWGIKAKRLWRRFDYSSIYLQIGGTFSPILLVNLYEHYPTLSIVWFCIMWGLIIVGITMVAIFGPGRLKWLHFPLYFIIGWAGIMIIPYWIKYYLPLFFWILGGGIVYTLGMIPFAKRGVKGAHFIWHFFVLAGAATHFVAIMLYIY